MRETVNNAVSTKNAIQKFKSNKNNNSTTNNNSSPNDDTFVNKNTTFNEYIKLILSRIGFDQNNNNYKIVIDKFDRLDENKKKQIINNDNLISKMNDLLGFDDELKKININSFNQNTKEKWDNVMGRLAELQGLVILKKIHKEDTEGIIDSLLQALDNKIEVINNILDDTISTENPSQTGGAINNVEKSINYLINKNNYLNFLKNNIY